MSRFKSHIQPFCRACGKPIAKHTSRAYFYDKEPQFKSDYFTQQIVAAPRTKAEAQRYVNGIVVSLRRKLDGSTITDVGVWDGETYVDEFFCKNDCAMRYARMCVKSEFNRCQSVAYVDSIRAQAGKKPK